MTISETNNYDFPMEEPKVTTIKSADGTYAEPGLPTPPAGYGKKISMTDTVDGDDEGPESKDEN